jgi:ligand-binding sensor domain-containing protein
MTSLNFRHLTTTDGLSDGVVRDIVQDKYGFIWIGTSYGLNRFDGITVKTFFSKKGDTTSLTNSYIQTLYCDKQGNLWIGTLKGLCRFDYETNRFVRYNASGTLLVTDIMQDQAGKIWASSQYGFWIVDESKKTIQKYVPPVNQDEQKKFLVSVRQIISSPDDNWYLATDKGIKILNPLKNSLSEIKYDSVNASLPNGNIVYSISIDSYGQLWAVHNYPKAVVYKINLKDHSFKRYDHFNNDKKKWTTNSVQKVMSDNKGRIWVTSTLSGISLYDEKRDNFDDYTADPLINNGPLSNSNNLIYQDKEGLIWLSTAGYGLSYFNPEKSLFNIINPVIGSNSLVIETWGRSVCEDRDENLWLGTGKGVMKFDRTKKAITTFLNADEKKQTIYNNSVRALLEDDNGDIWIGTAKGLNRYHPSSGATDFFNVKQGIPLAFFWMLAKDKNGGVWLGSTYGLYRYIREENRFDDLSLDYLLSKYAHKNIQALYIDSHNRVYIGMLDIGLVVYDIDKKEIKLLTVKDSLISDTRFSSFAEDRNGYIWIGAEDGLTAYDPVSNHSRFFTRENGLTSNRTNNIMVDSMNRIWIGTSNGLCLLNEKRDNIKKFDVNDGLLTNQFNEQAAFRTHDGFFIYPSYKGFVVFKPEAYKEDSSVVPVYITSFKISDKEINQTTEDLQNIHLKPDQNFFSIELAGLNYMNPYECTYAYRLEPFDKDWVFTQKREINYTNVPAGNYTFRYKVIAGNTGFNVPEKTIKISIAEVFYKTIWFKTLILILIVVAGIAFFRFRLKQREKILVLHNKAQLLEKEKALVQFENLKQQLNPHFLFNSLTSLRSLIRVDPKTATHFLDGLSKTYRYLLRSNDSELVLLEDELNFVQTFVELQKTRFNEGLQVRVNVNESCYGKYIVPVTLQNLIENAIKHNTTSAEQPLQIDIYAENNYIVVRNNLQKYRIVETSNQRGLASMKTLYSYLSGKPIIVNEDEKYFTVKIPLI